MTTCNVIAQAIKRAKSTNPNKIVAQMEKTDMVGTLGRIEFYGRKSEFTHALKYGPKDCRASSSSGRTASRSASGRPTSATTRWSSPPS